MGLRLVGAPEREAEPFALIDGEHPVELARRALYAAAEAEQEAGNEEWARIMRRTAELLPDR